MGQRPAADNRIADYAAVLGELEGGAMGSKVEHGGLMYAQYGKGELLVSRKGEWYTVPMDPRRKLDLLKSAHLASTHGSWHALDAELQLRICATTACVARVLDVFALRLHVYREEVR